MKHIIFPDVLGCGCCCADQLTHDDSGKARQRRARDEADLRKRYSSALWIRQGRDNETLRFAGFKITVQKCFRIDPDGGGYHHWIFGIEGRGVDLRKGDQNGVTGAKGEALNEIIRLRAKT